MKYTEFISEKGWYKMKLPLNWAEYEAEEGTNAFFNTVKWTGNFRITPIQFDEEFNDESVNKFINEKSEEHKDNNPILKQFGSFQSVSFKEKSYEDNEVCMVYFWYLRKIGHLYICSFTIEGSKDNSESNNVELEKINFVLNSIETI
jgi:hypothetical protein